MKTEVLIDYMKHIFHPFLQENYTELPVVLFFDGHNHISIPNATRILQPADKYFKFSTVKISMEE